MSQTLRVSMEKQPMTLDAIICQLCSGTLTIVNQRRADGFGWWTIKGSFSTSPRVLLKLA